MPAWATCCVFLLLLAPQQSESVPQRPQQVLGLAGEEHYLYVAAFRPTRGPPRTLPRPSQVLLPSPVLQEELQGLDTATATGAPMGTADMAVG